MKWRFVALVSGMVLLSLAPAIADPIQITAGSLQVTGTVGKLSLIGDRGFSLVGAVALTGGVFDPWSSCNLALQCVDGAPISLQAYFAGLDLRSSAKLDGRSYSNVGSLASDDSAAARFSGTAIAPHASGDIARVVAPFALEGSFSTLGGTETLMGHGIATLVLRRDGSEPSRPLAWNFVSASYDFSPAPEPATILLTAGGLAGLLARRRRR